MLLDDSPPALSVVLDSSASREAKRYGANRHYKNHDHRDGEAEAHNVRKNVQHD